jgi:ABC-type transporter Mla MlaB component
MLKIELISGSRGARIRLSGQLRSEQLDQLKSEIERFSSPLALDLGEVDLVDIDGIRFLNECESAGVALLGCSPYIKEWMLRERGEQANTK